MTTPTNRRATTLYRDPIDKKIGGVASGVARYFDIDTTLMRAIWAATVLVGGFGIFLYLVLWFILDEDPELLASLNDPLPAGEVAASGATDEFNEPEAEPPVTDDGDEPAAVNRAVGEIEDETVEAEL